MNMDELKNKSDHVFLGFAFILFFCPYLFASDTPDYVRALSSLVATNSRGIRLPISNDVVGELIVLDNADGKNQTRNQRSLPNASEADGERVNTYVFKLVNKTTRPAGFFLTFVERGRSKPYEIYVNIGAPAGAFEDPSKIESAFELWDHPMIKPLLLKVLDSEVPVLKERVEPSFMLFPYKTDLVLSLAIPVKQNVRMEQVVNFLSTIFEGNFRTPPKRISRSRERKFSYLRDSGVLDVLRRERNDREAEHRGLPPRFTTRHFMSIISETPVLSRIFPTQVLQRRLAEALSVGINGTSPALIEDVVIDFELRMIQEKEIGSSEIEKLSRSGASPVLGTREAPRKDSFSLMNVFEELVQRGVTKELPMPAWAIEKFAASPGLSLAAMVLNGSSFPNQDLKGKVVVVNLADSLEQRSQVSFTYDFDSVLGVSKASKVNELRFISNDLLRVGLYFGGPDFSSSKKDYRFLTNGEERLPSVLEGLAQFKPRSVHALTDFIYVLETPGVNRSEDLYRVVFYNPHSGETKLLLERNRKSWGNNGGPFNASERDIWQFEDVTIVRFRVYKEDLGAWEELFLFIENNKNAVVKQTPLLKEGRLLIRGASKYLREFQASDALHIRSDSGELITYRRTDKVNQSMELRGIPEGFIGVYAHGYNQVHYLLGLDGDVRPLTSDRLIHPQYESGGFIGVSQRSRVRGDFVINRVIYDQSLLSTREQARIDYLGGATKYVEPSFPQSAQMCLNFL